MDPRIRKRKPGLSEEQDEAVREEEYRAALSQGGPDMGPVRGVGQASLNGNQPGEVSPGRLESGEATGLTAGGALPLVSQGGLTSGVQPATNLGNPWSVKFCRR